MKSRLTRLAAEIASLRAARLAKDGPRVVAAELRAIGCHANAWENGAGVTVDAWDSTPERDEARERKLAELDAKGINAFVVVIDRLEDRGAAGDGDRAGGAGALSSAGPATPGARVTDPPTKRRKHV